MSQHLKRSSVKQAVAQEFGVHQQCRARPSLHGQHAQAEMICQPRITPGRAKWVQGQCAANLTCRQARQVEHRNGVGKAGGYSARTIVDFDVTQSPHTHDLWQEGTLWLVCVVVR